MPSSPLRATHPRQQEPSAPGIRYRVAVHSTQTHLFAVTLTIAQPAARQRVRLPVWIPGSYLVREFAQHLQHLCALQSNEPVPMKQLDKNTWQVESNPTQPLVLTTKRWGMPCAVKAPLQKVPSSTGQSASSS